MYDARLKRWEDGVGEEEEEEDGDEAEGDVEGGAEEEAEEQEVAGKQLASAEAAAEAAGLAEAARLEPEAVLERLEAAMAELKGRGRTATRSLLGWKVFFHRRVAAKSASVMGDFYFRHPALSGKLRSRVELRRCVLAEGVGTARPARGAAPVAPPAAASHALGTRKHPTGESASSTSSEAAGVVRASRGALATGGLSEGTVLPVGTRVKARFLATTLGPVGCAWYTGAVVRAHPDGSHDLVYEVCPPRSLRLLNPYQATSPLAPPSAKSPRAIEPSSAPSPRGRAPFAAPHRAAPRPPSPTFAHPRPPSRIAGRYRRYRRYTLAHRRTATPSHASRPTSSSCSRLSPRGSV